LSAEHCDAAPAREPEPPGEIELAVGAYVAELELDDGDPRTVTALVAVRLARQLDGRTSAAVARELRGCLDALAGKDVERSGLDLRGVEMLRELFQ
jgi:hypothetical protein